MDATLQPLHPRFLARCWKPACTTTPARTRPRLATATRQRPLACCPNPCLQLQTRHLARRIAVPNGSCALARKPAKLEPVREPRPGQSCPAATVPTQRLQQTWAPNPLLRQLQGTSTPFRMRRHGLLSNRCACVWCAVDWGKGVGGVGCLLQGLWMCQAPVAASISCLVHFLSFSLFLIGDCMPGLSPRRQCSAMHGRISRPPPRTAGV